MKHSSLALIGGLIFVTLLVVGECKSRPKQQAESKPSSPLVPLAATVTPSPSPTPAQATASPAIEKRPAEFGKVADRVRPAVILISVFDASGKPLRTGTGFFVSEDGRFVTSASVVEGGANAVAKTADGGIYDVSGILAEEGALDLALLRTETKEKQVPFLLPSKSFAAEPGAPIAVIGSPLARRPVPFFNATISAKKSDASGEWLEVSTAIPNEFIGSPVMNESGEVIGVVTTQRGRGEAASVVRTSNALDSLVAKTAPDRKARWYAARTSPTPLPVPPGEASGAPRRQAGNSRLIYSPKPNYPTAARHSHFPIKGNGRYRVTFSSDGDVRNVEVIESTRSDTLDDAAINTLRRWKSAPGQEWSANVPITFEP